MVEIERLRQQLYDLGLMTSAAYLDAATEQAVNKEWTYTAFLSAILENELAARRRHGEEMRLKLSRLPHHKTLDDFDFTFQPGIDERQVRELATLSFVARQENVFFLGPPGVGKTHLAVAIALEAISNGLSVYYVNLPQLLAELHQAEAAGKLAKKWSKYTKPQVLVIDEIGYTHLNHEVGEIFFRLVCARYEKGSMILTSNKSFAEWGELMGDTVLATAILDRLLHHAHVVNIRGNSYRLKDRLKVGAAIPAIVSPIATNLALG